MFQPFHRSYTVSILPNLSLRALRVSIAVVMAVAAVTAIIAPDSKVMALRDTVETVGRNAAEGLASSSGESVAGGYAVAELS